MERSDQQIPQMMHLEPFDGDRGREDYGCDKSCMLHFPNEKNCVVDRKKCMRRIGSDQGDDGRDGYVGMYL
jgi:hypothetical protein